MTTTCSNGCQQETTLVTLAADVLFFALTTVALSTSHWVNLLAVTPSGAPTGNLTMAPGATYVDGHVGIWTECMSTASLEVSAIEMSATRTGRKEVCMDADSSATTVKVAKGLLFLALILVPFAFWMSFKELRSRKIDYLSLEQLVGIMVRVVCLAATTIGGYYFMFKKFESLDNPNFADVALGYSAGACSGAVAIYGLLCITLACRACFCNSAPSPPPPTRPTYGNKQSYPVGAYDVEQNLEGGAASTGV